jgi:formylglycine-generating enzyme required for sulfatase activity
MGARHWGRLVVGALLAIALGAGCALVGGLDLGDYSLGDASSDAPDDTASEESHDAPTQDAPDAGGDSACPSHGGAMVRIPLADGGSSFCIDETEVTNAAYVEFLGTNPDQSKWPPECIKFGSDYLPANGRPDADTYPVEAVNWCQAAAFCRWAGKRLCGGLDGGAISVADIPDASASEWEIACTGGGQRLFPYGNTYDIDACTGENADASTRVGSMPKCLGGYAGLFDMSGNVQEFANACLSEDAGEYCAMLGGQYSYTAVSLRCSPGEQTLRDFKFPGSGIRCCAD